jgi:hypothetical protein
LGFSPFRRHAAVKMGQALRRGGRSGDRIRVPVSKTSRIVSEQLFLPLPGSPISGRSGARRSSIIGPTEFRDCAKPICR